MLIILHFLLFAWFQYLELGFSLPESLYLNVFPTKKRGYVVLATLSDIHKF